MFHNFFFYDPLEHVFHNFIILIRHWRQNVAIGVCKIEIFLFIKILSTYTPTCACLFMSNLWFAIHRKINWATWYCIMFLLLGSCSKLPDCQRPGLHMLADFLCPRIEWSGYIVFVLFVCLSVCFSVVNFNLCYNFWTLRDRDFILACILH